MVHKSYRFSPVQLQISFLTAALCNLLLTIMKEENEEFRNFLARTFYNPWLGQLILITVLFIALTLLLPAFQGMKSIWFHRILPVTLCSLVLVMAVYYAFKAF